MSYFPIDEIRGRHLVKKNVSLDLAKFVNSGLVPVSQVLRSDSLVNSAIEEVKLKSLVGRPVFEIRQNDSRTEIFDAVSGAQLSPVSESLAREIVEHHLKENIAVKTATLIKASPPIEYRGRLPVWRLELQNDENSSIYVQPDSGKVVALRSTLWRIYDFFWMLHIMDYWERDNFNSWWLILAALLGTLASLSGVILLKYSFRFLSLKRR